MQRLQSLKGLMVHQQQMLQVATEREGLKPV